jgi:D-alanyl-D-alanine carboxypeptidase/D-alanyl-D-alanine-endopeptidase (penicillin-binding protein 4)
MVPASVLKLLTTSAAITELGAAFRYETKIAHTGSVDNEGVLQGNIVISGSGDPSLQSEYFFKPEDSLSYSWALAIRKKNIKKINGRIIADAGSMERFIPGSWLWEDVSNYFGAAPCGLSFRDNKFKVYFTSGNAGTAAAISRITPDYLNRPLQLHASVTAAGSEDLAFFYGDPLSFEKRISGSIPPLKKAFEVEGVLPDPALLCGESLYASLKNQGVWLSRDSVFSNYDAAIKNSDLHPVYTYSSPPLPQIIYFTNQNSLNLYAESLLRTMGKGTSSQGIARIKKISQQWGLDTTALNIYDGCGLSRANTITCDFLSRLLCRVYGQEETYKIINPSLPVAGRQSSMAGIGKGTPLENNLRAKTGYMQKVRAYSGYLKTRKGRELAFTLIMNNYSCSAKEAKQRAEKFLLGLYEL